MFLDVILCIFFVPQADAIVGKLKNIGNQEKDAKPTVVISADTVCLFISPEFARSISSFGTFNLRCSII